MNTRKYRTGKQERYEQFLDGVQKKEEAAIKRCKPKLLEQMARIINDMEDIARIRENPNWKAKTLPKMRDLYVQLRNETDATKILKLLESEIAFHLNGWFQMRNGWVRVVRATKNDSFKHDPKAQRIDDLDLVLMFKNDETNCCKCFKTIPMTGFDQEPFEMVCEVCAVAANAH